MSKRIFIDGNINSELCIIATDGQEINYFDYSDELIASKKNNIYLGIVSRVEPSLQAAFIDFGSEKKAFLPFDEIHPSYFKIPHNEKLIELDNDKSTNETLPVPNVDLLGGGKQLKKIVINPNYVAADA